MELGMEQRQFVEVSASEMVLCEWSEKQFYSYVKNDISLKYEKLEGWSPHVWIILSLI